MSNVVPVVVGVGDIVNRSLELADAIEPADLILQAIEKALCDASLDNSTNLSVLQKSIDSISIVRSWTWPYPDLPGLLSSRLDLYPKHKEYTDNGGESPVKVFDAAARRIARGECKAAVVAGGEALASLNAFAKSGKLPPPDWTKTETTVDSVFSPTTSVDRLLRGTGRPHGIGVPVHVYPLFENGYRAYMRESLQENHEQSAQLYASFADVAQRNEHAWNFGETVSAGDIGTINEKNRMICSPYPLLMNAFNTVNLAAACVLTSTTMAKELSIPQETWIYPLGGAGTQDSKDFWDRPNFHSSPALERSIDAALEVSHRTKKDIDCYDIYSCFPIVPKLAARHLGLSCTNPVKPLTLLGGLTSFGGAGNNYSMHALTAMVRELRTGKYRNGLVLGNGGVLTNQYAVCLSSHPRPDNSPFPTADVLPKVITDVPVPTVDSIAHGRAIIETYTVEFDRQNKPTKGHVVGRLKSDGHRFLANHGDDATLQQLASWTHEPIGRDGEVMPDPDHQGRNLFFFNRGNKL